MPTDHPQTAANRAQFQTEPNEERRQPGGGRRSIQSLERIRKMTSRKGHDVPSRSVMQHLVGTPSRSVIGRAAP
jgi:hypothetical protein